MHDHVGDVAVHEELAGHQADDLVGRHAAVGTADPQVGGRLLRGERLEEVGVALDDPPRPQLVVFEKVRKVAHPTKLVQKARRFVLTTELVGDIVPWTK